MKKLIERFSGLVKETIIGIWPCLESAFSYRARYSERFGYPMFSLLGKTGKNKIRKNWSKNYIWQIGQLKKEYLN